jgi:hypothetical protein
LCECGHSQPLDAAGGSLLAVKEVTGVVVCEHLVLPC